MSRSDIRGGLKESLFFTQTLPKLYPNFLLVNGCSKLEGKHMADIKKVWLLYIKGGLMFLVGLFASFLLISIHFELKTLILLVIATWGFCRLYYFAFYVIQNYIDPRYKYSGLIDFAKYSIKRRFR